MFPSICQESDSTINCRFCKLLASSGHSYFSVMLTEHSMNCWEPKANQGYSDPNENAQFRSQRSKKVADVTKVSSWHNNHIKRHSEREKQSCSVNQNQRIITCILMADGIKKPCHVTKTNRATKQGQTMWFLSCNHDSWPWIDCPIHTDSTKGEIKKHHRLDQQKNSFTSHMTIPHTGKCSRLKT